MYHMNREPAGNFAGLTGSGEPGGLRAGFDGAAGLRDSFWNNGH